MALMPTPAPGGMPAPVAAPGATQIPTAMVRPPAALQLGHAMPGQASQGQPMAAGLQSQARLMAVNVMRDMQVILSMLPTGSPEHKDFMRALDLVSKHAPAGVSTAELTIRQLMQAANHVGRSAALSRAVNAQPPGPMAGAPTMGV